MAYSYYSPIDIKATAVGADEINFPAALVVTDNRFRTVANGGHINNTDSSGGASGSLVVPADFVAGPNSDGSSPWDFEFVDYSPTSGLMEFWVEVASVSSSQDTPVYLTYGDSGVTTSQEDVAGTWGNSFAAVYHLGEASGTLYDSTGNANGTAYGTLPTQATGKVGSCQRFNGSSDYINTNLNWIHGDQTICAWAAVDDKTDDLQPVIGIRDNVGTNERFYLWYDYYAGEGDDQYQAIFGDGSTTIDGPGPINSGTFYYVSLTWDDSVSSGEVFENATAGASGGETTDPIGIDYLIGTLNNGAGSPWGYYFDGDIDELHISSIIRDDDWITTSYNNQNDSTPDSTFWSALGSEQSVGGVVHELAALALAASTTPAVNLAVLREMAAAAVGASTTPSTALRVLRAMTALALSQSTTPAATLAILRTLVAIALAASATPDDVDLLIPQLLRPGADSYAGSWTTDTGGSSNLYQAIDEASPSDSDYIRSETEPVSSPCVVQLDSGNDPEISTGHDLSYRYRKDGDSVAINLTVELREAYVSEASQGTLIADWQHNGIGTTVVQADQTLTTEQADSITDYTDLHLRFVAVSA